MIRPPREGSAVVSDWGRRRASLRGMAIAGLAVVGLTAAGCGSSGSASGNRSAGTASTAAGPLTKADFVAKGNAICVKGTVQTEKAGSSLGNNPTEAEAAVAVPAKFVPAVQTQINELKALSVPTGEAAALTNMLDLAQADLDRVKNNPKLAFEPKTFADFANLAHGYGLKSCAPRS